MSHPIHGTLLYLGARPLPTVHGDFTLHRCQNLASRALVLVATFGDVSGDAPLLARVHSSCVTSETLGSCDCDCAEQLDAALAAIADAGRGAIFYLMQEGRGAGFAAKARDRMLVQASGNRLTTFEAYARMGLGSDHRRYEEVVFARALLGVTAPLRLLTNNPEKLATLASDGVPIAGTQPLRRAPSPFSVQYLAAKAASGHLLGNPDSAGPAAALPERVTAFEPSTPAGAPGLVQVASYLVPIALPETRPVWLRLHAFVDVAARADRIALCYGPANHPAPLVRLQLERLDERFPLRGGGVARRRWHDTLRAFVAHGAGCAVLVLEEQDGGPGDVGPVAHALATVAWLVTAHARARRVRPLVDGPEPSAADRALAGALAAEGVDVEPARALPAPG